jgi:hypothetical protein
LRYEQKLLSPELGKTLLLYTPLYVDHHIIPLSYHILPALYTTRIVPSIQCNACLVAWLDTMYVCHSFRMYTSYVNNYGDALKLIAELRESKKEFDFFMNHWYTTFHRYDDGDGALSI